MPLVFHWAKAPQSCDQSTLRPTVIDRDVLALEIAGISQTLPEPGHKVCRGAGRPSAEEPDHRHRASASTLTTMKCRFYRKWLDDGHFSSLDFPHSLPYRFPYMRREPWRKISSEKATPSIARSRFLAPCDSTS